MAAALPEHRLIFSRMRGREHCLACCVDLGAEEHLTDEPLKQPNAPLIGQARRLQGNVREPRSNKNATGWPTSSNWHGDCTLQHGVCRGYPRGRKKLEKSRTISQQLQSDLHSVHAAAAERQAREEERTAFREPALLARGGEVREQGKSRCLRHQSCLGPTSSHRAAQCASSGTQGSRNDGANPSREFSAFFRRFLPTSSAF
jgi:hypothetical protein